LHDISNGDAMHRGRYDFFDIESIGESRSATCVRPQGANETEVSDVRDKRTKVSAAASWRLLYLALDVLQPRSASMKHKQRSDEATQKRLTPQRMLEIAANDMGMLSLLDEEEIRQAKEAQAEYRAKERHESSSSAR
jgi:hypothetical protein